MFICLLAGCMICMHHPTAEFAETQKENVLAYRVRVVHALHNCRTHGKTRKRV